MDATITSKGQMTLPKAIRDELGLKAGDRVKIFLRPNGGIVLMPTRPVTDLKGILKYDGPPVSIEEMDEAIAEACVERDCRSQE